MKKVKKDKSIMEILMEMGIERPKQLKKEIYPDENIDPKARFNEQEDYPGTQPDLKPPDKPNKIAR